MGGDSNPWCLAAHTLSRRAQSTALSPILLTPALAHTPAHVQLPIRRGAGFTAAAGGTIHRAAIECRQKIHRIRVLRAYRIKTNFVDDFLNLESVARKKSDARFSDVDAT